MKHSNDQDAFEILRANNPVDPSRLPSGDSPEAQELLARIKATNPPRVEQPSPQVAPRPRRRLRLLTTATATTLLVTLIVLQPWQMNPAAALATALENTSNFSSFRATIDQEDLGGGEYATSQHHVAEFSNGNARIDYQVRWLKDGTVMSGESIVIVDGRRWLTDHITGRTVEEELDEAWAHAPPLNEASSRIVKALLESATVQRVGSEDIASGRADHYRIELDEDARGALAEVSEYDLLWFDLVSIADNPRISTIDIWVTTDNVIAKMVITGESSKTTTEFFDLGSQITILPPDQT